MDTTKIDATLAWMADKAEHIGEGMQMTGVTLIGMVVVFPAYTIMAKIGIPMYVIGKCISKFLKPNDKSDDIAPLPPVKDIKGNVRIGVLLAVTALTLLTGCATVRGWFASPQAHDIERTVRGDLKSITTNAEGFVVIILHETTDDAKKLADDPNVQKIAVTIAPLL